MKKEMIHNAVICIEEIGGQENAADKEGRTDKTQAGGRIILYQSVCGGCDNGNPRMGEHGCRGWAGTGSRRRSIPERWGRRRRAGAEA